MKESKVSVTVQYVGQDDFVEEVAAQAAVHAIKVRAMKKFELDPGAAEEYVLQYGTADLKDHSHIGDLGVEAVTLRLVLKEDVTKG